MMAKYECLRCHKRFEAPWTGEAWLMATRCVHCGGAGVSSQKLAYEDGCMTVEGKEEKEMKGVKAVRLGKAMKGLVETKGRPCCPGKAGRKKS